MRYPVFLYTLLALCLIQVDLDSRTKVPRGDFEFTIKHDGLNRKYLVHVPESYHKDRAIPVVLALHGGGGNARGFRFSSGLDETSERYGFLSVYPSGTGRKILRLELLTWNAGGCCGEAKKNQVDDVGFISMVLDDLERRFSIDKDRVFATGMSNGAQMSYRLACELSSRITAIAPVASQMVFNSCQLKEPVPTIHFHGKRDRAALWGGGQCGGLWQEFFKLNFPRLPIRKNGRWDCDPVPISFSSWNEFNGLENVSAKTILQRGKTTCESYRNETAHNVLCVTNDAGHTWPGGNGSPACKRPQSRRCKQLEKLLGKTTHDVSASELMWKFFKTVNSKPGVLSVPVFKNSEGGSAKK
ncbi:hypothetical protein HOF92_03660 [bacterium]|jgi:polyhydroxybutyrate depolymerase|nr:hypothetical protein [bacterium]